jgi:hypothetical protein
MMKSPCKNADTQRDDYMAILPNWACLSADWFVTGYLTVEKQIIYR